jgi:subtilisin family serine protease
LITNFAGPNPGLVKYVLFDFNGTIQEFATNSSTIYGHTNAAAAEAVGAAAYFNTPAFGVSPPVLDSFSSAGGTPILFDSAGNRLASAEIGSKPEIVAPDGGDTTFFGTDTDGNGFPNFFGTSAAAPHAAGVAALLLQARPGSTPIQIYAALENTRDRYGYFRLRLRQRLWSRPGECGPRCRSKRIDEHFLPRTCAYGR